MKVYVICLWYFSANKNFSIYLSHHAIIRAIKTALLLSWSSDKATNTLRNRSYPSGLLQGWAQDWAAILHGRHLLHHFSWLKSQTILYKIPNVVIPVRGMSEKKRDWCHWNFISIWNQTLYVFPFKIVSLKSITLFHSFLPCIYGILEGFFWDRLQFHGHGPFDCFYVSKPFDCFYVSKIGSFNDFL